MSISAPELNIVMQAYSGGSTRRYRHALNSRFIVSEGVHEVAKCAEAFWLLDIVALKIAPLFAKAWLNGETSIGIIALSVPPPSPTTSTAAYVSLSLTDDEPVAYKENLPYTDFPPGTWNFYLGSDEIAQDQYVTTMYLPVEH